jgi:hypothetical protein
MRTITKGLLAGAVGLAVIIPAGVALAADDDRGDGRPGCTSEERQARMETHEQQREEILAQLEDEGITDPDQVREELRTRLHAAMEAEYGDMPGPMADMPGPHDGEMPGPMAGMGPHDGGMPMPQAGMRPTG